MVVTVTLLGAPRVERDGKPQAFDTRKAMALRSIRRGTPSP